MTKSRFRKIQTLQYLGSKSRILDYVCTPMLQYQEATTVIDLFAGTGAIGYAMQDHKRVVSNDLEYYSYVVNQAVLNGCEFNQQQKQALYDTIKQSYLQLSSRLKASLLSERSFFRGNDMEGYKTFCHETPSIFNPKTNRQDLEPLEELVKGITPGGKPQGSDTPCLFLSYYSSTYFGIRQCCEIDAICSAIHQQEDQRIRYVLLTALMSAMSKTASTTTHFAQYLKINSFSGYKNLVAKRSTNIITLFKRQLSYFEKKGLLNMEVPHATCYNMDYLDMLNRTNELNHQCIVYADPPYFKEHYSRYYHILNTVCLYDYPVPDVNPQTKDLTVGRYRSNRNVSPFGKKAQALLAFKKLVTICSDAHATLFISYADDSIVKIETLYELALQYYHVEKRKIELNHSKQGRNSVSKVNEILLICRPQSSVWH